MLRPKAVLRVYPHGRGAAPANSKPKYQSYGLSPRAWGSLDNEISGCRHLGSIPTGVGQPISCGINHPLSPVYPHGRGAATYAQRMAYREAGLSPRAWGSPIEP